MKKTMLVIALVLFVAAFAAAQVYTLGNGITGVDKLGAHQNGGKGCVGCHAPHSGSSGNGGNAVTGGAQDKVNAGNYALWGQDLGPLYGYVLTQGDKVNGGATYTTTLPAQSEFFAQPEEISGVMMCLSCHDGNIAQGAMMTNKSYEQATGLLPKGLYGPNAIPTLLGQDGTAAGNYYNDHPIGSQATLGAVGVASKLQYVAAGCSFHGVASPCLKSAGTDANFTAFISHYGLPNITSTGHSSPVALPTTNPNDAYLICITCHTPHSMYVASANADAPIHTLTKGTFPSYFFIAAPYNMGSNPGPTQASSATQFCRQCHYSGAGGANEASGILNVDTAF
jgi:cytochrome c553